MNRMLWSAVAGALVASALTSVSAQTTNDTAPAPVVAAATPAKAKLICEDSEDVGSRLSRHKVCKTAQEWREQRATDRMDVDRAQLHSGLASPR